MHLYLRQIILNATLFAFFISACISAPFAYAQDIILPKPGVMMHLSSAYNPPVLKGIKIHPDNPFKFEFILDVGDGSPVPNKGGETPLQKESQRLIKYFLASLTIPEKDLWVNLSPYEKNRIVPDAFGQTEMGRDLLAQDYMLKQITASLIYPEDEIGKKFWKRVYEEAAKKFGTTNISVNTFNKVWIVPDKAVVYENLPTGRQVSKNGTAYVVESRLQVMLEEDYLAQEKNQRSPSFLKRGLPAGQAGLGGVNQLGSQIIREIVIPTLTKEVNEGKNFAQLRQVYNSLILAQWYKKKIKDSILNQVYADKNKVEGVQYNSSVIPAQAGIYSHKNGSPIKTFGDDAELIYQQYLQAFKKGAYNYIKEEVDPVSKKVIPRKYFSGGVVLANQAMITTTNLGIVKGLKSLGAAVIISVSLLSSAFAYQEQQLHGSQNALIEQLYNPDPRVANVAVQDLKKEEPAIVDQIIAFYKDNNGYAMHTRMLLKKRELLIQRVNKEINGNARLAIHWEKLLKVLRANADVRAAYKEAESLLRDDNHYLDERRLSRIMQEAADDVGLFKELDLGLIYALDKEKANALLTWILGQDQIPEDYKFRARMALSMSEWLTVVAKQIGTLIALAIGATITFKAINRWVLSGEPSEQRQEPKSRSNVEEPIMPDKKKAKKVKPKKEDTSKGVRKKYLINADGSLNQQVFGQWISYNDLHFYWIELNNYILSPDGELSEKLDRLLKKGVKENLITLVRSLETRTNKRTFSKRTFSEDLGREVFNKVIRSKDIAMHVSLIVRVLESTLFDGFSISVEEEIFKFLLMLDVEVLARIIDRILFWQRNAPNWLTWKKRVLAYLKEGDFDAAVDEQKVFSGMIDAIDLADHGDDRAVEVAHWQEAGGNITSVEMRRLFKRLIAIQASSGKLSASANIMEWAERVHFDGKGLNNLIRLITASKLESEIRNLILNNIQLKDKEAATMYVEVLWALDSRMTSYSNFELNIIQEVFKAVLERVDGEALMKGIMGLFDTQGMLVWMPGWKNRFLHFVLATQDPVKQLGELTQEGVLPQLDILIKRLNADVDYYSHRSIKHTLGKGAIAIFQDLINSSAIKERTSRALECIEKISAIEISPERRVRMIRALGRLDIGVHVDDVIEQLAQWVMKAPPSWHGWVDKIIERIEAADLEAAIKEEKIFEGLMEGVSIPYEREGAREMVAWQRHGGHVPRADMIRLLGRVLQEREKWLIERRKIKDLDVDDVINWVNRVELNDDALNDLIFLLTTRTDVMDSERILLEKLQEKNGVDAKQYLKHFMELDSNIQGYYRARFEVKTINDVLQAVMTRPDGDALRAGIVRMLINTRRMYWDSRWEKALVEEVLEAEDSVKRLEALNQEGALEGLDALSAELDKQFDNHAWGDMRKKLGTPEQLQQIFKDIVHASNIRARAARGIDLIETFVKINIDPMWRVQFIRVLNLQMMDIESMIRALPDGEAILEGLGKYNILIRVNSKLKLYPRKTLNREQIIKYMNSDVWDILRQLKEEEQGLNNLANKISTDVSYQDIFFLHLVMEYVPEVMDSKAISAEYKSLLQQVKNIVNQTKEEAKQYKPEEQMEYKINIYKAVHLFTYGLILSEKVKKLQDAFRFYRLVHGNFFSVLGYLTELRLTSAQMSEIRSDMPINNVLTRFLQIVAIDSKLLVKIIDFELFYGVIKEVIAYRKSQSRIRNIPQDTHAIVEILRQSQGVQEWSKERWVAFKDQIIAYLGNDFPVVTYELFKYFIKYKDDALKIKEFKDDVEKQLGSEMAWGGFQGLSQSFMEKHELTPANEVALLGRYMAIANQTAVQYAQMAASLKLALTERNAGTNAWHQEVDASFRQLYALKGSQVIIRYQSSDGQQGRDALNRRLVSWAKKEYKQEELRDVLIKLADGREMTEQERGIVVASMFRLKTIDATGYAIVPEGDGKNLDWLDQWGILLDDTWNDFRKSNDFISLINPLLPREVMDKKILRQKLEEIFKKDYEQYKEQRSFYKQIEGTSEEEFYVGYFDDFFHLMGIMMTGCCTWDVRDKQVMANNFNLEYDNELTPSNVHFGTLALQDAQGRLLGKAQVQLLRTSIKGLDWSKKATKGWQVLSVVADNISKEEFGMSKYKAFLSMLKLAQQLAEQNDMQAATLTVSPIMHAQGNPEHGFVKELVSKGWLKPVVLEEEVVIARKTDNHGEYKYHDVYVIAIPKGAVVLDKAVNRNGNPDSAMRVSNTGGIDLSSDESLTVKHDGTNSIDFHLDPAMIKQFNDAPGLFPIITGIEPMVDLIGFLEH